VTGPSERAIRDGLVRYAATRGITAAADGHWGVHVCKMADGSYVVLASCDRTELPAVADIDAWVGDDETPASALRHRVAAQMLTLEGLLHLTPDDLLYTGDTIVLTPEVADRVIARFQDVATVAATLRGLADTIERLAAEGPLDPSAADRIARTLREQAGRLGGQPKTTTTTLEA